MEKSWLKSTRWMRALGASSFDEVDIDPRITVTESCGPDGAKRLTARLKDDCGMSIVPKRILRSDDRTIVFWQDGTKTIVKRASGERASDYAAFTAAFAIKLFGSNTALKKMIDKKLEYQKVKHEKMRFSVGDIVKTKDTLVCGAMYNGFTFGSNMMTEGSEIVRVDDSDGTYKLSNGYWYPPKMLEPATLETVTDEDDKE